MTSHPFAFDKAPPTRPICGRRRGHGRTGERITRVAPATGIDFPYAAQVSRIVRHRGDLAGTRHSKQVVYGITDLPPTLAGPQHIATYARHHWEIENGTHHVRDVTFGEDGHQPRTGTLPRRWQSSGTWRAAPCDTQATPTSPTPDANTSTTTAARSPCSESHQRITMTNHKVAGALDCRPVARERVFALRFAAYHLSRVVIEVPLGAATTISGGT